MTERISDKIDRNLFQLSSVVSLSSMFRSVVWKEERSVSLGSIFRTVSSVGLGSPAMGDCEGCVKSAEAFSEVGEVASWDAVGWSSSEKPRPHSRHQVREK